VVLWVLAMLAVLSASFAFKARTEARITRLGLNRDQEVWTARAGVQRAAALIREHARDRTHAVTQAWFSDPALYRDVAFGPGRSSLVRRLPDLDLGLSARDEGYGLDDEEGRLNVNVATPEMLMAWPGVSTVLAEAVVFFVVQAREREAAVKAGQAKTPDQVHPDGGPGETLVDGPVRDLAELLAVPGMTRELLFGAEDGGEDRPDRTKGDARDAPKGGEEANHAGLAGDWTCFSSGTVNVNTARPRVLAALGLDQARVDTVLAMRRPGWDGFGSVDEFLAAVGAGNMKKPPPAGMLDVRSRNFRIDCRAGRGDGPGHTAIQARLTLEENRLRFTAWRVSRGER
jgi:general secretion pathway protein K